MKVFDSAGALKVNESDEGSAVADALTGAARNLVVQSGSTSPNSEIVVSADEVVLRDSTSGLVYIARAVAVSIDLAGGVGTPNSLDTGVEAANTWYYVWLIYDGTTVAGLFSASATAPTLPAGYTFKARVGAVRNDATSILVKTYQADRRCSIPLTLVLNTAAVVSYAVLSGATLTTFRATVPPTAARFHGVMGGGVSDSSISIAACSNAGTVDAAALGEALFVANGPAAAAFGFGCGAPFEIPMRGYNFQWRGSGGLNARLEVSGFTLP